MKFRYLKYRVIKVSYRMFQFLLRHFSGHVTSQIKYPLSIPIVIINFNQLAVLKKQIELLKSHGCKKIFIVDNSSTYPPLLDYYTSLEGVNVIFNKKNEGHHTFFKNRTLFKDLEKGYFVVTDPDILPNEDLPRNFLNQFLKLISKYSRTVNKVGFALSIDDIPDFFPAKDKVISWEAQFWQKPVQENIFKAKIDTTFALYKPYFCSFNLMTNFFYFFDALRVAGVFSAKHAGWHIDPKNRSEEEEFYFSTSNSSNSWKFNAEGELAEKGKRLYK